MQENWMGNIFFFIRSSIVYDPFFCKGESGILFNFSHQTKRHSPYVYITKLPPVINTINIPNLFSNPLPISSYHG